MIWNTIDDRLIDSGRPPAPSTRWRPCASGGLRSHHAACQRSDEGPLGTAQRGDLMHKALENGGFKPVRWRKIEFQWISCFRAQKWFCTRTNWFFSKAEKKKQFWGFEARVPWNTWRFFDRLRTSLRIPSIGSALHRWQERCGVPSGVPHWDEPRARNVTFPTGRSIFSSLVGGLEHFLFSPIVGMMIQSD